jgi:hypothetical protein
MVDTPLSAAPATRERVLYDARAVADVCVAEVAETGPEQVRAALRTMPATHSGSASAEGVFVDAATGGLVDNSGAPASLADHAGVLRYEGSYEVLAVVSGPAGALSGRYSWTEPRPARTRGITPNGIYDPFARPGVVVCRYDPAAQGAPFDQVGLLPEGWQIHVRDAARAPREPGIAVARDWLAGPNDLLFARAAWTTALAGRLDRELLTSLRGQVHGYRRAVLHFATLAGAGLASGTDALDTDLADRTEPDHRRAAALGLLSARLFAPEATAAALSGWQPAATVGGLMDPALTGEDNYIREAFSTLAPANRR